MSRRTQIRNLLFIAVIAVLGFAVVDQGLFSFVSSDHEISLNSCSKINDQAFRCQNKDTNFASDEFLNLYGSNQLGSGTGVNEIPGSVRQILVSDGYNFTDTNNDGSVNNLQSVGNWQGTCFVSGTFTDEGETVQVKAEGELVQPGKLGCDPHTIVEIDCEGMGSPWDSDGEACRTDFRKNRLGVNNDDWSIRYELDESSTGTDGDGSDGTGGSGGNDDIVVEPDRSLLDKIFDWINSFLSSIGVR